MKKFLIATMFTFASGPLLASAMSNIEDLNNDLKRCALVTGEFASLIMYRYAGNNEADLLALEHSPGLEKRHQAMVFAATDVSLFAESEEDIKKEFISVTTEFLESCLKDVLN